jgi:hypothetical protein
MLTIIKMERALHLVLVYPLLNKVFVHLLFL